MPDHGRADSHPHDPRRHDPRPHDRRRRDHGPHDRRRHDHSLLDRLADACVRSAARRWPATIRDGMAAEWLAELAVLRRDPRLDRAARSWRQLAYALSLALSPSVSKENPMSLTWRDRLPALGLAARRLTLYAGVAFAAVLLPQATSDLWYQVSTHNSRDEVAPHGAVNVAGTLGAALLAVVAMILLGVAAARWAPRPAGRALPVAAFAVVPIGAVGYLLLSSQTQFPYAGPTDSADTAMAGWGFLAWAVIATVVLAFALRLAAAGRRVTAVLTGVAGLLVAVDLAGAVAGLSASVRLHASLTSAAAWSPLSLLPPETVVFGRAYGGVGDQSVYHASSVIVSVASEVAVPALMSVAFLGAYLLRARPVSQVEAAQPAVAGELPAGAGGGRGRARPALGSWRVRGYGYATAAVALVVWGCVLAQVGLGDPVNFPMDSRGIVPGTAFAAILLAVLAFMVANAGRGPVVAPAVAVFAVLTGVDRAIYGAQGVFGGFERGPVHGPHGPAVAAALVASGAAVLAGAAWLTGRLAGEGTTSTSARQSLAGVVIVATFSVPVTVSVGDLFAHRAAAIPAEGGPISGVPPLWLAALALTVVALLVTTAFVAAVTARPSPLPRPATAVLAVLAAVVAVLPITIGQTLRTALYWPIMDFFAQPVLAVVILVVLRWRRPARPVLAATGWLLAGLVGAVLTVPLYDPLQYVATLVSGLLLPGNTVVSLPPYQFGPMTLGVVVAAFAGRWLVPPERGATPATVAPDPDPVPAGPVPAGPETSVPQPRGVVPAPPQVSRTAGLPA